MVFKSIIGVVSTCLAVISFNTSALVMNTLNGVDYEWFDLYETLGLSREEVVLRLNNVNDVLYGYEYASRSLFADLLGSYAQWDTVSGWHSDTTVVTGVYSFHNDFKSTYTFSGHSIITNVVDSDTGVQYNWLTGTRGIYGTAGECGLNGSSSSCQSRIQIAMSGLVPQAVWQEASNGWDDEWLSPNRMDYQFSHQSVASFLVRREDFTHTVYEPNVAILMVSGLVAFGVARKKSRI